jgi:hypothetical protein
MAAALTDLAALLEGIPAGAWVAISETRNKVLAHGPDAQVVLRQAQEQGEDLPLIVRVPDQNAAMFV